MFFRTHPLLRFLLIHCLIGIGAGWSFLAAFLAFDIGGVAGLVFGSPFPALPLGMLMFGTAITFGGVAMGAGVMMLGEDGGAGRKRRVLRLPVRDGRPDYPRVRWRVAK